MRSLLLMVLLCVGVAYAQSVYRWVDEQGQVHFGDRPPATAVGKVEEYRLFAPAADRQVSFATRQATENYPVTLYVDAGCGDTCKQAGSYLRKRGIPFAEKIIETDEDVEALAKQLGSEAKVPVLQVGSRSLKGYEETRWNNLLDAAGYPKTP